MPLEPTEPGRPARKLERDSGLSRLIPFLIGAFILVSLAGLMFVCSAGSQIDTAGPAFEDEVMLNLDRQAARMNATSALKQGRRSLERYHAEHARYTIDHSVVIEEGFWEDVTIEIVEADEDAYCMEASSGASDRRWHLGSDMKRPRPGPCP